LLEDGHWKPSDLQALTIKAAKPVIKSVGVNWREHKEVILEALCRFIRSINEEPEFEEGLKDVSSKRKADDTSSSNGGHTNDHLAESSSSGSLIDVTAEAEELANKRLRAPAASFSEEFICSITHGLMVDPVVAEDGNTYERNALLKRLKTNNKRPLNPSQPLYASRLVSNRAVLLCIEKVRELPQP
jgi:hypothetical protein